MTALTADVVEIFSGIQGEGVRVGLRQIFVRFHGCNLSCRYCDTPASRGAAPAVCHIERDAGGRVLEQVPNPLTVTDVLGAVRRLQAGFPHQAVSLTGGEPLLRPAFLNALLPAMQVEGIACSLETNGVLPDALAALARLPDEVAMDIKLPAAAGMPPAWAEHAAFLRVLQSRWPAGELAARLQVKMVFTEDSLADLAYGVAVIAACHRDIPCVLQPVTPRASGLPAPSPATVLAAQHQAAQFLSQVRVIPQTHVLLGQW